MCRHEIYSVGRMLAGTACIVLAGTLAGCGSGSSSTGGTQKQAALQCNDTMKTAFKPNADTTVVAVKSFQKGDPLILSGAPTASTPVADADLCLVKLNVGPGNPGPANAPSTSSGIGIAAWLPAKGAWDHRIHNLGGGGWQGGPAGNPVQLDHRGPGAAAIAAIEGAVSSFTDTGHSVRGNGDFAMNPEGSINEALWTDFSTRSLHMQAVVSKALATAYYGSAPTYMYWEGGSTGGRQGLMEAQDFPGDYNGIIANYPAINWTRFITYELYPQIVFQRDLGGVPLTPAQEKLVSEAAISACDVVGGRHLGYIPDPSTCDYDPTQDPNVLCTSAGGTNNTTACVTKIQAQAMNKTWYGMTPDGSVPSPAVDNGWADVATPSLPSGERWWGLPRGALVAALAGSKQDFTIASDQVALELQNSKIADPSFMNATGNGQTLWKLLTYSELANAYDQGLALQAEFDNINTNNPDLSAFKTQGGKLITWDGLADFLIPPQGNINYYNRVAQAMGGMANAQDFYHLYLVPGAGHGVANGTPNPNADVPSFGLSLSSVPSEEYDLLTKWVEQGIAPGAVTLESAGGHSGLSCVYPAKAVYSGSGDPRSAASYACK